MTSFSFRHVLKDEHGAVTVDWLLLTATAIGLAIGGMTMLQTNASTVSDATSAATSEDRTRRQ